MWSTEVEEEVPYEQLASADGRPVFYLPSEKISRQLNQGLYLMHLREISIVSKQLLRSGPALHPDLVGILLRFRKNQVGVMGDIQKMLLKISLKEEDGEHIVTCGEIWTPTPHLRFIE